MQDFSCADPDDLVNPLLRERVKYLKEVKGGQQKMCKIMEEMIMEEKIEAAKKAIKKGKNLQDIADILDLPLFKVEELAHGKPA